MSLSESKQKRILAIYNKYVIMSQNVTNIFDWSKKATITKSILACKDWTPEMVEQKEAISYVIEYNDGNKKIGAI